MLERSAQRPEESPAISHGSKVLEFLTWSAQVRQYALAQDLMGSLQPGSGNLFVKGYIIHILKFEDHEALWPLYRQHVMYVCLSSNEAIATQRADICFPLL